MFTATLTLAALTALAAAKKPTPTTTCTGGGSTETCTSTVCADYVNDCGQTYGGCYPFCSGYTAPTFTDPGCPPTITSSSTLSASASCTQTICADYINDCGQWYGMYLENRASPCRRGRVLTLIRWLLSRLLWVSRSLVL